MGRVIRIDSGMVYKTAISIAFVLTMMAGAVTVSLDTLPEKQKKAIRTARSLRSSARRSTREILDIWNH